MAENIEYSIVIPVYNSSKGLKELYQEIKVAFKDISESYETIFIDDFSQDESWKTLQEIKIENPESNITIISLTRNFGQHKTTLCGIDKSKGDFIITIDDDLQIPPKEIKKLIEKQKEKDFDLVYGSFKDKKHSKIKNIGSDLVQTQSEIQIENNLKGSSFRLFKAKLKENFGYHKHRTKLFIDELLLWNTGYISAVEVEHNNRKYETSSYSFNKLINLGFSFIMYATTIPLKFIIILGFIGSISSFTLGLRFVYRRIFFDVPLGYTSIIVTILFSTSLILLIFGVLGRYLNELYILLNKKPPYLINKIIK
jgi:undecaprenyl-phosphate 4-deoxy-4-formamido-L-arabinose transferase